MKKLIPILILMSCTKEVTKENCAMCYLLSEKRTYENIYIRTDTLFKGNVCGSDLDKFRNTKDTTFKVCDPEIIERWIYKIGK